jgi:hypothetical protein
VWFNLYRYGEAEHVNGRIIGNGKRDPVVMAARPRISSVCWMRLTLCTLIFALACARVASAQPLKVNPTPQDYVETNGGGATIVPAGQLVLDGHRLSCGNRATVLDPNLNDYAAAPYPQFVILNMPYVGKVPTAVKLWIYSHECGHLLGGPDENKADCFAVRRGRFDGWLTPQGLDEVCSFISAARPDAAHASGPDRCNLMRECWRRTEPMPAARSSVPLPTSKPAQ